MHRHSVTAAAPGSVGNLGPGLDILGLAVDGPVDEVEVRWGRGAGLQVMESGHRALPTDPERNAATIAAAAVLRLVGEPAARGVEFLIHKGLPLSAGQGGSAASAVAGAAAMNALLGAGLSPEDLVRAALEAETRVAGRHADNVAPSALGGLVLVRSLEPLDLVPLPVPPDLRVVLAHPDQECRTADGRAVLPAQVPLDTALHQAAQVAGIVAACLTGDLRLLGRAIDDRIAEPARAPHLRGFLAAKAAALDAGALGCSISGSGPTAFALVEGEARGASVADAMTRAYHAAGVAVDTRLARPSHEGVRIL